MVIFLFILRGKLFFIAGLILPLASGTAPAAKGVVMEMVSVPYPYHSLDGLPALLTLHSHLTSFPFPPGPSLSKDRRIKRYRSHRRLCVRIDSEYFRFHIQCVVRERTG